MEVFTIGLILSVYVWYMSTRKPIKDVLTIKLDRRLDELINYDVKAIESIQADHEHRLEQLEKRAKANGIL